MSGGLLQSARLPLLPQELLNCQVEERRVGRMKSGKQLGSIALGCIVVLVGILLSLRQRSDAFSPSPPILDAKAEDLRATHVSAVLGAPIQPGTNLLRV